MSEWMSSHPVVIALGWTLVHFLWQGLLLAAAFRLVMRLLRLSSASARYWTGMIVMAAMLITPAVTFIHLYEPTVAGVAAWAQAGQATVVAAPAGAHPTLLMQVEALLPWAVVAWFAGVLVNGLRLSADLVRIRRLATRDLRPLSPEWQRVVARLMDALGIRRGVRVMESLQVSVPMVVGWIAPVILIPPSAMMGLTTRQLELIISHELAHIRRLDYLLNLLQVLTETLLFYHPAVAYVSRWVRTERENCCDDIVVAHTGDSIGYARALTEIEGLRCSSGMQIAVAATGGYLRGRVQRLVAMPAPQRGLVSWVAALALVGTSGAVLTSVGLRPEPAAAPAAASAPGPGVAPLPGAARAAPAPLPPAERVDGPRSAPADGASPAASHPEPTPAPPAVVAARPTPIVPAAATAPSAPPARPDASAENPAPRAPGDAGSPPPAEPLTGPVAEPLAPDTPDAINAAPRPLRMASLDARPSDGAPAAPWDESYGLPELEGGEVLRSVAPDYPNRARREGIEGMVKVRYLVDREGRVRDLEILEASPSGIFEGAVKRALKGWRYQPYTSSGRPVSQIEARSFEFVVEDGPALPEDTACHKVTGSRMCRGRSGYRELGTVIIYNSI